MTQRSAATVIVDMATDHYEVRRCTDGTVFAVPRYGIPFTYPLRGGRTSLRAALARQYFAVAGAAAPQQALADALLVLEGRGQDRDPEQLHLRVGRHEGAYWLDLGDATGRAVRLTADGWAVTDQGLPLFRRTALTTPLPEPTRSGDTRPLWDLLNVGEDDRALLLAWLVSTLLPDVPHPVVGLFGEQGTGKTTAGKVLSMLVDPSPVAVRKAPRDADSWVTAASGSWVVALDNLSTVSDWLSDTLCRAVTGDGDVRRQLYTDGGLVVFAFRRCVIVTGIDLGAVRGDLSDRLLPVNLHRIPDNRRRDESELWPRWAELQPVILGGLLDLAARVIGVLPSVRLDTKPRMADYAGVLAAVDQVLGTAGLDQYVSHAGSLASDSLTADPFVMALHERLSAPFKGTSAELLAFVTPPDERWRPPKRWPSKPREVTMLMRRQVPVMRQAGWMAEELPPGHDNVVRWSIRRPEKAHNGVSRASHDPGRPEKVRNGVSQDSRDSRGTRDMREHRLDGASHATLEGDAARQSSTDCESRTLPDSHSASDVSAGQSITARLASPARHDYPPSQDAYASEPRHRPTTNGVAQQPEWPACADPECSEPARRRCHTCLLHAQEEPRYTTATPDRLTKGSP
ncbi:MAG: ATP-binding protein [Streptosporangiales bacterium]|nr:ATP-binding protein [Streptosporangiales bacterium]